MFYSTKLRLFAFKTLVIVSTIVTIWVNLLATLLPLNGKSTAQLSNQYPVSFVPAGYVFSIWGIIYLGMIVFAVYQFTRKDYPLELIHLARCYMISCIANCLWIIAWHLELITYSVIIMIILLAALCGIYFLLVKNKKELLLSSASKLGLSIPFSIYLGWISVATIANITVFFYTLGWRGSGIPGELWSAGLMITAGVIAGLLFIKYKDVIFSGVIIWSLIGIIIKFPATIPIVTSGLITIVLLFVLILYTSLKQKK